MPRGSNVDLPVVYYSIAYHTNRNHIFIIFPKQGGGHTSKKELRERLWVDQLHSDASL